VLAELAACNAAFAIIKQTLSNGRELVDCSKAITDFVTAKDTLQKKAHKKKNSFWNKVGGSAGDDLEEFMALEKVRKQENQLRETMQLYGRAGLWQDWIKFQAEARKRRQLEQEERIKKRKKLIELLTIAGLTIVFGALVLYFAFFFYLATRG
jgi:hypothetical protein